MEIDTQKNEDMDNCYNFQKKQSLEEQVADNLAKNNFNYNLDGTIDARDKNFRQCLQVANNKPYPTNKDGSPDMRCTKNPYILKLKLERMMKK